MRLLVIAMLLAVLPWPSLAVAQVEHTPIPRDAKPDFSPMLPLIGTWDCKVASSRRPRPFPTVASTFVSSDGYWLVTETLTGKVPWNPVEIHNTDYVTYDPTRGRWIDMSMDNFGAYDVSVSNGWNGNSIVWAEVTYPKLHGAVAFSPRTLTTYGPKKTVLRSSIVEASGRRVAVVTTCIKR